MTTGFLSIDVTKSKLLEPIIETVQPTPQFLEKDRQVRVILPYDYHISTRFYPVLYLQDAQNLFDVNSPFGNWGIDKSMASLAETNHHEVIIVCIDHGGKERIHEFSPYPRPALEKAEGIEYADFIVHAVKPQIDAQYRTLKGRAFTGIGGSSLGGLIALYAGMQHTHVFGKWMVFSPSLWAAAPMFNEASRFRFIQNTDIFFYAGGKESHTMESQLNRFVKTLQNANRKNDSFNYQLLIHPDGGHSETEWGRVFPNALKWLYFDAIE